MRQLIAHQSVKQFDTQNVKNWHQSIIFWFNWHNTFYKINIFNNKLKTIISLQFIYTCHFKYIAWQMKSPTISIKLFIQIRCNRKTLTALKFSTQKSLIRSSSESNIYCKSHILHGARSPLYYFDLTPYKQSAKSNKENSLTWGLFFHY